MAYQVDDFKKIFSDTKGKDLVYKFLQVVFHLYPEDKFHFLLTEGVKKLNTDAEIYAWVQKELPKIKPFLSEFSYALPALKKQKNEMRTQTVQLLKDIKKMDGYLEIGSTGRYYSSLKKEIDFTGNIYYMNDFPQDYSPAEIMERGGIFKFGTYLPLDNYANKPWENIPDNSLDLITCYIGLHHCPTELLSSFVTQITNKLKKGGNFILRDHDVNDEYMGIFCSLIHSIFNIGTQVTVEANTKEFRSFKSIQGWIELLEKNNLKCSGEKLLQDKDPSLNTLILCKKI